MAKKKPAEPTVPATPRHTWVCEGCGHPQKPAVSPPDQCELCEHPYFENLADIVREMEEADQH